MFSVLQEGRVLTSFEPGFSFSKDNSWNYLPGPVHSLPRAEEGKESGTWSPLLPAALVGSVCASSSITVQELCAAFCQPPSAWTFGAMAVGDSSFLLRRAGSIQESREPGLFLGSLQGPPSCS